MEGVTLWKSTCCLSASLPTLVLVAPAGGSPISSQSRRWHLLGLAPVLLLFLLQLNSLNQSQGLKPLKGPSAIGGLDQGLGLLL